MRKSEVVFCKSFLSTRFSQSKEKCRKAQFRYQIKTSIEGTSSNEKVNLQNLHK